jgi:shikimate dehydrogenase
MPLKKAVIPLLDAMSPVAVAVGAVNTVTFPSGSAPDGAVGDNTDVYGLACALRECGHARIERALVLGGGATAASTLAALLDLGCREPIVGVRSAERVRDSLDAAERLDVHPRAVPLADAWGCLVDVDVVVSTVPIDASAGLAASLDAAVDLPSLPTLLDVVYAPWPTPLAQAWQRHGGRPVGGLAMLLHQAVAQVLLMTGRPGPVEVMRAAGERELLRKGT